MDGSLGQELKVVKREHPAGERGVRSSLLEVAQRVAEGGNHPKVRAWSLEQLERARRLEGISGKTDRERADVLLRAVQKKLWVPDPVGTEFMAGAHLMACDASTADELCFLSGDCDDMVVLLGSCFLSVGLHCVIVGHAYDADKNIQHVLLAVRVRKQGGTGAIQGGQHAHEWLYADPSLPHLGLGKVTAFTRERLLSVPNVKVICDQSSCLVNRDFDPDELGFVQKGIFVGVDGVPERAPRPFQWLSATPPQPKFAWLGADDEAEQTVEKVLDECQATVRGRDLSTAAGRAQAFENGGKCAADALCTYYSGGAIPPGVCGTVAGPVLKAVVGVWNSIFGGPEGIDCSKVSTFDPCDACKMNAACNQYVVNFDLPGFQQCMKNFYAKCHPPLTPEQASIAAIVTSNRTILDQYDHLWSDALTQFRAKLGASGPFDQLPPDKQAILDAAFQTPGLKPIDELHLDLTKPSTGLMVGQALAAIAPAYQAAAGEPLKSQYIPAGAPAGAKPGAKPSSAVPVVLGVGGLGALAYFLFFR